MRNVISNFLDEFIKSFYEIVICMIIKIGKNIWFIKILYKYGEKK